MTHPLLTTLGLYKDNLTHMTRLASSVVMDVHAVKS